MTITEFIADLQEAITILVRSDDWMVYATAEEIDKVRYLVDDIYDEL